MADRPDEVYVKLANGDQVAPALRYLGPDDDGVHVWETVGVDAAGPDDVLRLVIDDMPLLTVVQLPEHLRPEA